MSAHEEQSAVAQIADFLSEQSGQIIAEWMATVRRDPAICATEKVTEPQLRDHMPQLLADLVGVLRHRTHSLEQQAREDSHLHGEARWQYGYELSELLRELTAFRFVLTKNLHQFEQSAGHLPRSAMVLVRDTIHRFIDDLIRRSSVAFVAQQQAEITAVSDSRMRLLRSVSHELRNLVNSISLVSQELAEEHDAGEHSRIANVLNNSVGHMREMLDHLLDLARFGEPHLVVEHKEFDPCAMASELAELYRIPCHQKGIKFSTGIDPHLSTVVGDPNKTRQIANNLLSNAVKFTAKGEIIFTVKRLGAEFWSIGVKDTGIGIPENVHPKLFAEFYRAPGAEEIPGTGLGLAITKKLAELLKGTIRVESKSGEGTYFEVILPQHI